jgi:hypothetical protein
MFIDNPHFQAIKSYYGEQCAKRSGVPYIKHIQEGLVVLDTIHATQHAHEAYCLHPILQADEALAPAFLPESVLHKFPIDLYSLALAMEYRYIANSYLSHRTINSLSEIKLSPLNEVQQMLIADKVQNRKDFEQYHKTTHPRSAKLDLYFRNWLTVLGISEERYLELIECIRAAQIV